MVKYYIMGYKNLGWCDMKNIFKDLIKLRKFWVIFIASMVFYIVTLSLMLLLTLIISKVVTVQSKITIGKIKDIVNIAYFIVLMGASIFGVTKYNDWKKKDLHSEKYKRYVEICQLLTEGYRYVSLCYGEAKVQMELGNEITEDEWKHQYQYLYTDNINNVEVVINKVKSIKPLVKAYFKETGAVENIVKIIDTFEQTTNYRREHTLWVIFHISDRKYEEVNEELKKMVGIEEVSEIDMITNNLEYCVLSYKSEMDVLIQKLEKAL